MLVRYREGSLAEAVTMVENLHRQYSPGRPVEITFMDDAFNQLYQDEILTGKLAGSFTGVAIVISCLGLFGLISFSAQRRRREIGVRKVFGANVRDIVLLLCRDFVALIGISLVIGLPFAYWVATRFLSEYQFHTGIGFSFFAWTIGSTFFVAIAAVSFQSIKAAVSRPVETLRSE
jgi:ABC-type antimicrobial peptide transport system permease subunit